MVRGFAPGVRDLFDGFVERVFAARDEKDPGAGRGESDGEPAAETGGRSRDERDLSVEGSGTT